MGEHAPCSFTCEFMNHPVRASFLSSLPGCSSTGLAGEINLPHPRSLQEEISGGAFFVYQEVEKDEKGHWDCRMGFEHGEDPTNCFLSDNE